MKKLLLAALTACVLGMGLLTGCGQSQEPSAQSSDTTEDAQVIKVVCSSYSAYDWVRQIVGDEADNYELTYLLGSGVDLHSYQPTVADVAAISDADLFVYVGGESDGWAADAVAGATNPNFRAVNLLEAVGDAAVEEELVEGMEAGEHEHEHEEGESEEHEHEEGAEYDEHIWLSLRCAKTLVGVLADELCDLDPAHAEALAEHAAAYQAELDDLDARYAEAVESAAHDTVVFADRFPFRYLVDDYDLSYYAAFVGCSAETEASFETVAFLAEKVDELGLKAVCVIENSDGRIAQTVVDSTQDKNQQVLVMDSLQSATDDDIAAGKTYLGVMESNLEVLSEALA